MQLEPHDEPRLFTVQIEKDIAAGPQGEDNGDRVKTARAEADAARERAETIQRSRNCEWLRLRWHAVATCALGPPELNLLSSLCTALG